MTGNDVSDHATGRTILHRKSSKTGSQSPKTNVLIAFHYLLGSISQQDELTWQEMTSHHLT